LHPRDGPGAPVVDPAGSAHGATAFRVGSRPSSVDALHEEADEDPSGQCRDQPPTER